jgi:hypothetical protein
MSTHDGVAVREGGGHARPGTSLRTKEQRSAQSGRPRAIEFLNMRPGYAAQWLISR